jgi:hypothetical protein
MQLSLFFGENAAIGEQITADIKKINDFRSRCDVAIGKRLLEAKRLIFEAHVGFPKTALKHYQDWANQEFGISASTVQQREKIAECWGGDDEELIDKFTIGALYEIARAKNPEVKEIALEQARSGESVSASNVVDFRARVEPKQAEAVRHKETKGVDIMALKLEYYEIRVAWMTDLLKDILTTQQVTQEHLTIAAANSLFEDIEELEIEEYDYAISA